MKVIIQCIKRPNKKIYGEAYKQLHSIKRHNKTEYIDIRMLNMMLFQKGFKNKTFTDWDTQESRAKFLVKFVLVGT